MMKFSSLLAFKILKQIKSHDGLKKFLIKASHATGTHKYALVLYSKIAGLSNTYFPNWLISETMSLESFKHKYNGFLQSVDLVEQEFDEVLDEAANKFISPSLPSVAILCSVYRSDNFLVPFLINLVRQEYFFNTEPCFVICNPSNYELEILQKFTELFPNSKLHIYENRVGIYSSWNRALRMSNSPFITNMNVDDSRRTDSIKRQVEMLIRNPFVDVVYQDVHVTLMPHLPWGAISSIAPKSSLPSVSYAGLLAGVNPPHNAPMWRRKLHADYGFFDESLKSAGDYEFWLRIANAGSLFMKDNDAHVSYFLNPKGLSTRTSSSGTSEIQEVQKRYLSKELDFSGLDRLLAKMARFGLDSDALTIAAIIRLQEMKEMSG